MEPSLLVLGAKFVKWVHTMIPGYNFFKYFVMNDNSITGLHNPEQPQDSATKQYIDTKCTKNSVDYVPNLMSNNRNKNAFIVSASNGSVETWKMFKPSSGVYLSTANVPFRIQTLKDIRSSEELRQKLCVVSVSDIVRQGRLRWFGHVERKDVNDWVSACRNMVVSGERGRGRGRKTWRECVADDMRRMKLKTEDAQDCVMVRWLIGKPSNPCKRGNTDVKTMMMMMMICIA
jgi:hypothetical protein